VSDESLDYASAGVDIDAPTRWKRRIRSIVESTFTSRARGRSAVRRMFRIPSEFRRPVLVSSADGVGTKLRRRLSRRAGTTRWATIS